MWVTNLATDSRKTCFVTVPQKWGINFSQLPTIKIQQSLNGTVPAVYATCVGESGFAESENVVIGAHFARLNDLASDVETAFQVMKNIPTLSSVIAEPCFEEDWELLEMNVDQIQSELMNRVRIVWLGAKIPIWLSDFVSLSIRIIEFEPKGSVGMLATDTEIHVSPPKVQPKIGPLVDHQMSAFRTILTQILERLPKPQIKTQPSVSVQLRILPIEDAEFFLKQAHENYPDMVIQPYIAFVSKTHTETLLGHVEDYIGCIRNDDRTSYFSLIFVESSQQFPIYPDAIYLSAAVIRQLRLNLKERVEVLFHFDNPPTRCESINLYTFNQDYDIKDLEKDVRMWLQSVTKDRANLVLNHGQHLDIPCLVKKTNRLFIGVQTRNDSAKFCRIDEKTLSKVIEKLKVIRVQINNAPQYLQLVEDDVISTLIHPPPLGGVTDVLEEGRKFLKAALGLNDTYLSLSCTGCQYGNLLLTGPRGSGKTSIANHLCHELEQAPFYVHVVSIACASLKGKQVETLKRDWDLMFHQLVEREPSVLILDDLDVLVGTSQNNQDDSVSGESWYYKRIATLLLELVKSTPFRNKIIILATAISGKSLYPTLYNYESSHFFTCELSIPPLTKEMRLEMVRKLLETSSIKVEENIDVSSIISKMDGYVAIDIRHIVDKAIHFAASQAGSIYEVSLNSKHLELAVEDYVPIGLHGINLKPPAESRVAWSDVGGLTEAKRIIIETLKWPTQYPELFSSCPLRLRSAVLLYGAPGTGKTMLARAVATECEVNFISIKGPELLSKYIGASEEAVRETFRRARSAKPCILFFDEFDSLAPRRGHDSTGVTDRVVNQLLTELDGVEGQEAGLWVLAATSRPDLIDPALLRPGRFDVSVRCPLPDKEDRLDILKALSSRLHLEDDVLLDEIAIETECYSGADLQAILYTAQLKAVHQLIESDNKQSSVRITHQLLVNALRETWPSVTEPERQRYDRIYENFDSGKRDVNQLGPARVTLA